MSEILTADAELDKTVKAVREEGELSQRTHGIGRGFGEHVAQTLLALRAERDDYKANYQYLAIMNLDQPMELSSIKAERDFQRERADKWVAIVESRDADIGRLAAERDALREERDGYKALREQAAAFGEAHRKARLETARDLENCEALLAEARAEIARLTGVLQERYDVVERAAKADGVQIGRDEAIRELRTFLHEEPLLDSFEAVDEWARKHAAHGGVR